MVRPVVAVSGRVSRSGGSAGGVGCSCCEVLWEGARRWWVSEGVVAASWESIAGVEGRGEGRGA